MWGRDGGRGDKSYDSEKAWSFYKSFNTICPSSSLYTQPKPGEKFLVIYYDARHTHTKRQTKTNKPLPLLSTFIHIFSDICTYVDIQYTYILTYAKSGSIHTPALNSAQRPNSWT
jgi:hypothetical protein